MAGWRVNPSENRNGHREGKDLKSRQQNGQAAACTTHLVVDDFLPRLHNPSTRVQKSTGADRCLVDTRTNCCLATRTRVSRTVSRILKLCGNCFMAQVPESTKSFTQPVWAEKRSHKTSRPSSKPLGSRFAQVVRRACFKQSLPARCIPLLQLHNP